MSRNKHGGNEEAQILWLHPVWVYELKQERYIPQGYMSRNKIANSHDESVTPHRGCMSRNKQKKKRVGLKKESYTLYAPYVPQLCCGIHMGELDGV